MSQCKKSGVGDARPGASLCSVIYTPRGLCLCFLSVTVAGQPFPLSLPVYSPGPKTRREVFIQNCVIWTILNARESRMGSRLAAAIATRNTTEMLLEKEKGLVGGQNTVSVTVANLSKAMGG